MNRLTFRLHPGFFIMAGLISLILAWSGGFSWGGFLLWMGIIFFSVFIHELGHAFTAIGFGQRAHVELTPFGGVTIPSGSKLSRWKEFLVILAGPLFGLSVYGICEVILLFPIDHPSILIFLEQVKYVNLFWTVVNLLPILPLDGGQLMRNILEHFFGFKSFRISLLCSMVFSILLGVLAFVLFRNIILSAIFLFFAFQSFDAYRRLKGMKPMDQDASVHRELQDIEQTVRSGDMENSIQKLYHLREKIQEGLIYNSATELLAKLLFKRQQYEEIYNILKPIEANMGADGRFYLLCSAFQVKDFEKVITLSGACFRETRDPKVAAYTAQAHGMLGDAKNAIMWLQTVKETDPGAFRALLEEPTFNPIRENETFQSFIKRHREK